MLDDLPSAAAVVGTAAPTSFGVFGDVVLSGRWRMRERNRAATVFGDLRVRSSPPGRRSDRSRHHR